MKDAALESPQTLAVDVGDAELPCLLYEGGGPPLLLLHATGFQPWLWHPVARELAGEYSIAAPSFGTYREADPEKGGLSWLTLARDTVRLCESLHLERPFLAGHSMGATVLVMAHALFGLPAAALVLIEPIFLPAEFYGARIRVEDHPLAAKAIKRTNRWRDREEALAYLRSRALFQGWDEEMLDLYVRHGMVPAPDGSLSLACTPRQEAALFMGGMQYNPWPLLSGISCPVLILEGGKSENGAFMDLDRMQPLIPDCRRHTVPDAGHLIPMERPGEVARLMGDFFRPLAGRP